MTTAMSGPLILGAILFGHRDDPRQRVAVDTACAGVPSDVGAPDRRWGERCGLGFGVHGDVADVQVSTTGTGNLMTSDCVRASTMAMVPGTVGAVPTAATRARDEARAGEVLARMSLEERVAQLVGYWVDQGGEVVAPMQDQMAPSAQLEDFAQHGLGHLTRVYGTRPVDPVVRARWLRDAQRRLVTQTRLGIPAIVHEECLTGLAAWQAATFPTPLAWGASFDPDLVQEAARAIGDSMRELGIHQGLAPVLDVICDPRWGRVDECIGEDPYLVGTIGTAYVRGLQDAGVHATLKHFLGYSGSRSGRNHAPVSAGPREVADVFLPPFEMAVLDGGARSVMNSYNDLDGVPIASSTEYLTTVLRERWGFDGVVVADYFAVETPPLAQNSREVLG